MSDIRMGVDVTPAVAAGFNAVSNIWTSWQSTEQAKLAAKTADTLAASQKQTGFSITPYVPWVIGGIAGLAVLSFVMRR